jgi:hypothetical protein
MYGEGEGVVIKYSGCAQHGKCSREGDHTHPRGSLDPGSTATALYRNCVSPGATGATQASQDTPPASPPTPPEIGPATGAPPLAVAAAVAVVAAVVAAAVAAKPSTTVTCEAPRTSHRSPHAARACRWGSSGWAGGTVRVSRDCRPLPMAPSLRARSFTMFTCSTHRPTGV